MSKVKKYLKEAIKFLKVKDFKRALSKLELLLMVESKLKRKKLPRKFTDNKMFNRTKQKRRSFKINRKFGRR